jgi:putative oxidoreductase
LKFRFLTAAPLSPIGTDLGLLLLRLGTGLLMATHGYDKLLNLLAGNSADFPDPLGVGPTFSHVLAVGGEFFCSVLLALGLLTRPAALGLIATTLTIAFGVHGADPLSDKEHALLFLIPALALLLTGPGRFSLDATLFKTH